ncbi:MAG: DUF4091 domain-containing protein [Clostridiales bacterium]|nr:DUF4091 domain-containing protein [Clostridiales bacterium]
MFSLQYGLADESYKHCYGIDYADKGAEAFLQSHTISLVAARRDWVAFQVLLRGNGEFTVSVGDAPVFSPKGPIPNVRLKAVVDGHSEWPVKMHIIGFIEDDDRIMKADILLNDETVHVEPDKVQPIWVEICIPKEAKAGIHRGKVGLFIHTMFEDEVCIGSLEFELVVKDVVMPEPSEYGFHLDLWQHPSNISRKHEVHLWSQEHFKVLEEYIKSLGELGQKAVTVIVSEIPWSGQRCFRVTNYLSNLFEYSMIPVERNAQGRYSFDFSVLKRYIELCFQYGIDKEIEVFGLVNIWISQEDGYGGVAEDYPDAIRVRYYDRADGCYKYMKSAEDIKCYIKALEGFFIENGWIDRVRVVADEPSDVELYRRRLNLLKEIAPSFKYKTAINHAVFISEFKDEIDDFVPVLPCVCEEWELLSQLRGSIRGRLMWYVCCWPPIPNTFISSPLLESRLIGILTAYMDFDGFLRWNYTVWPERPRERISYRFPHWKAGDTNFVYPGNDGRPLLTLRYKNLKRGIEDFELINMVKKLYPDYPKRLEKIWDRILFSKDIRDFHPSIGKKAEGLYSLDYEDYLYMRGILLDLIAEA